MPTVLRKPRPVFGERRIADARFLFPPDPALSSEADIDLYLSRRYLPWRKERGRIVIAAAGADAETQVWLRGRYASAAVAPIGRAALDRAIAGRFPGLLLRRAALSLSVMRPGLSARRVLSRPQAVLAAGIVLALAAAFALAPDAMPRVLVLAASVGFVCGALVRFALAFRGGRRAPARRPADDLPVYTVLAPLYREGDVLPQLAASLASLDYPRDRLDIKFIVEADDLDTRHIAERLSADGRFETVVVPPGNPRTKPKALNFALPFVRGECLVIYDAEDRPEPDQLLKAVAAFRDAPDDVVCLQARLAVDNAEAGWISTMFAIDYDIWFAMILPALERFRAPLPLGGTSNHFRTAALKAAAGWDPFNVTEDADLGIRLARLGGRVAMLDSRTFEDAPTRLPVWFGQRARWLKGYMQTILVHLRDPVGLVAAVGARGVAGFAFFICGAVWSALGNPVLWLIGAGVYLHGGDNVFADPLCRFALAAGLCHAAANITLVIAMLAGGSRRMSAKLMLRLCGFVFYWLAISAAAWLALWQLIRRPHHWEKTPHQRRKVR